MTARSVPDATVQRLPIYLQVLERLDDDVVGISSEELASDAGVNAAKVRKDLSYLGSYGTRGVGYDAEQLRFQIRQILGLNEERSVVIVGVGNLGRALANFGGFPEHGFRVVALFDADPDVVGSQIADLVVEPIDELPAVVGRMGADIGVITVPAGAAQDVATQLADAGVRSILNFAPAIVKVPESVEMRRVDLSNELQVLSFYLHRTASGA